MNRRKLIQFIRKLPTIKECFLFILGWRIEIIIVGVVIFSLVTNGIFKVSNHWINNFTPYALTALLPSIVTFCTLFVSIADQEVYGMSRKHLNSKRKKAQYPLPNKLGIVISCFILIFLAAVCDLHVLFISTEALSIYVAIDFVVTETPFIAARPGVISSMIKDEYYSRGDAFDSGDYTDLAIGRMISDGRIKEVMHGFAAKSRDQVMLKRLYKHITEIANNRVAIDSNSKESFSYGVSDKTLVKNLFAAVKILQEKACKANPNNVSKTCDLVKAESEAVEAIERLSSKNKVSSQSRNYLMDIWRSPVDAQNYFRYHTVDDEKSDELYYKISLFMETFSHLESPLIQDWCKYYQFLNTDIAEETKGLPMLLFVGLWANCFTSDEAKNKILLENIEETDLDKVFYNALAEAKMYWAEQFCPDIIILLRTLKIDDRNVNNLLLLNFLKALHTAMRISASFAIPPFKTKTSFAEYYFDVLGLYGMQMLKLTSDDALNTFIRSIDCSKEKRHELNRDFDFIVDREVRGRTAFKKEKRRSLTQTLNNPLKHLPFFSESLRTTRNSNTTIAITLHEGEFDVTQISKKKKEVEKALYRQLSQGLYKYSVKAKDANHFYQRITSLGEGTVLLPSKKYSHLAHKIKESKPIITIIESPEIKHPYFIYGNPISTIGKIVIKDISPLRIRYEFDSRYYSYSRKESSCLDESPLLVTYKILTDFEIIESERSLIMTIESKTFDEELSFNSFKNE